MTATGETRQFLDEDATKLLLAYGLRLKSLARIWKGTISQNFRAETDIGPVFVRIRRVNRSSMPSSRRG